MKKYNERRFVWIDLCKTVGLFLVILGHGRLCPSNWQQFIYSFHMPLFFILSGFLYKYKPFKETLIHDFKRLIIPYYLINSLCLLLESIILIIQGNFTLKIFSTGLIGIICVGCYNGPYYPVSVPTWFIVALFIARILLSINNRAGYRIILFVVSTIVFFMMKKMNIDTWIPLDSALMSMPFILLGILMKPILKNDLGSLYKNKQCLLFCLFFIFLILLTVLNKYNGLVDIAWSSFGNNLALFYLNGIIGSFLLIILCQFTAPILYKGSKFCKTISEGSLLIIGFNLYFVMLFQTIIEWLFFPHVIDLITGMLVSFIIIVIFYFLTKISMRLFPMILGMK